MPEKFVILSMPRSGTGFLYTMLNSHPDIVAHGELFKPRGVGALSGKLKQEKAENQDWLNGDYRQTHPIEFMEKVLNYDPGAAFSGFKLFFPQNEKALYHVISSQKYRKIHLRRDNILAMYSSARTAQAGGQGKVKPGEEVKRVKIQFTEEDFEYFRNRRDNYVNMGYELLERSGHRWHEVEYTELKSKAVVDSVVEFIGAKTGYDLHPAVEKRNPGDILERFENPDDVRRYMDKIGHPEWLEKEF